MKYLLPTLEIIAVIGVIAVGLALNQAPAKASVSVGSSYVSAEFAGAQTNTSYKQSAVLGSAQPSTTTPLGSGGLLGSVVITGAGAGSFAIYDATTSNATLRTTSATTSLKVLAQFPANASAGTYTFDEYYQYGLAVEFTGAIGTSTITYRSYGY